MQFLRRCWAEINLDAIAHNYNLYVNKLKDKTSKVIAVIKANAYGHGANQVAKLLNEQGCRSFAVSNITEAMHLRASGVQGDIMLLGYTPIDTAVLAARYDVTLCLHNYLYALELNDYANKMGVKLNCNVLLDTGMGRIGFDAFSPDTVAELVKVCQFDNLNVVGAFAHFPCADSESDEDVSYSAEQITRFNNVIEQVKKQGVNIPFCHHANSAAGHKLGECGLNAIRLGIALYGLTPTCAPIDGLPLQPAMTLKTVISHLKTLPAGRYVSYGRTYVTTQPTQIATVTIGYADGYNRLLSNCGEMCVKGQKAQVIGRVTMDQVMLNVSGIDCAVGDEVIVFGEGEVTATTLANQLNTINYEITCNVSARVPRVYYQQGRIIEVCDNTY